MANSITCPPKTTTMNKERERGKTAFFKFSPVPCYLEQVMAFRPRNETNTLSCTMHRNLLPETFRFNANFVYDL